MARSIPTQAYEAALEAVDHSPEGASIEQIEKKLLSPPNRRTLQRWLNDLIGQGRLRREGQGRATRYLRAKVVNAAGHATAKATATAYAEFLIPLSAEARTVEAHVRQPLQMRKPVGYNRAFLDNYRPNESFYLSESVRAELLAQGQAVNANEPAGTYARQIANRLLIDLPWNSRVC